MTVYCSKCGSQIQGDDAFCVSCGTDINREKAAVSQRTAAAPASFPWTKYIKPFLAAVVVIAVAIAAVRITSIFKSIPEVTEKTSINISNIENKIISIGELATLQYDYTNIIQYEHSHQIGSWNIPFTQKSYLVSIEGTVKIGLDMSSVSVTVSEQTKSINITIPKAVVLSHELIEDNTRVLEESSGLFNKISISDWATMATAKKQEVEAKIAESDMFTRAENDAVKMLHSFLTGTVPEEYTVHVTVKRS